MANLIESNPQKTVIDTRLTRVGLKSLGRILKIEDPDEAIARAQRKVPNSGNFHSDNQTRNNVANNVRDLERDIFWSLYSSDPRPLEEWEVPQERLANKEVIGSLQESPLWDKVDTIGNSLLSSIFAKNLVDTLLQDESMQDAMSQGQEGDQDGDQEGDGQGKGGSQGDGQGDPDKNNKSQQAKQKAKDAMNKNNGALRASAMSNAQKETENAEALMSSYGLDSARSTIEDYEQCLKIMEKMGNQNLTRLIEMVGRVKGISASFVKANTFNPNGIICNAGMTQNIINGFCSEVAMLSNDAPEVLRDLKKLEWADRGILGMTEGIDADRSGGMIIMVDFSGSMNDTKLQLAKALALGFSQSALSNNQKFTIQGFSTSDDTALEKQVITEKNSWMEILKWATLSARGGTDFIYAMDEAMKNLGKRENKEEYDIIFITDGESNVDDETIIKFKELKALYGTRLIMLRIDSHCTSSLDTILDAQVDINGNTDLETASNLLGEKLKEAHDK